MSSSRMKELTLLRGLLPKRMKQVFGTFRCTFFAAELINVGCFMVYSEVHIPHVKHLMQREPTAFVKGQLHALFYALQGRSARMRRLVKSSETGHPFFYLSQFVCWFKNGKS